MKESKLTTVLAQLQSLQNEKLRLEEDLRTARHSIEITCHRATDLCYEVQDSEKELMTVEKSLRRLEESNQAYELRTMLHLRRSKARLVAMVTQGYQAMLNAELSLPRKHAVIRELKKKNRECLQQILDLEKETMRLRNNSSAEEPGYALIQDLLLQEEINKQNKKLKEDRENTKKKKKLAFIFILGMLTGFLFFATK